MLFHLLDIRVLDPLNIHTLGFLAVPALSTIADGHCLLDGLLLWICLTVTFTSIHLLPKNLAVSPFVVPFGFSSSLLMAGLLSKHLVFYDRLVELSAMLPITA